MEDFQAPFLPSDGEDLDEVCNVGAFVTLKDGSRWTATVYTVAEVERLMKLWAGTDEESVERVVRQPGEPQALAGPLPRAVAGRVTLVRHHPLRPDAGPSGPARFGPLWRP
ncbi:hypothetical protein [Streptomyces cuspidosporus]